MASIYGGASGNGWKLRLDYTVTQDRAANTSSLRLRLYLYANTTGSYNLEKDSAYYVLQGQKVYQTYQYTAPGWYLLGERTVPAFRQGYPCDLMIKSSVKPHRAFFI